MIRCIHNPELQLFENIRKEGDFRVKQPLEGVDIRLE